MSGRLVILSGPSGVGKDALIADAIRRDPRIVKVVTYTTRAPREGEKDGTDYHFVSKDKFFELADGGHFFEHKNPFKEDWYASPKTDCQTLEAEGKIAILKIDVEGALEVMAQRPDALTVFILPPSMEELERRIRARGQDDEAAIQRRLEKAAWEMEHAHHYRRQIINDDFEAAAAELSSFLSGVVGA